MQDSASNAINEQDDKNLSEIAKNFSPQCGPAGCDKMHRMTPAIKALPPHEDLKDLLKEANYDDALRLVDSWDFRSIFVDTPAGLPRLRLCCMVADVMDYGGRYADAERAIHDSGHESERRLSAIRSANDLGEDHAYEKQACWAVIMRGMSFYRGGDTRPPDYEAAMRMFQLARKVLEFILEASHESCFGTLARVWYCIGLVERQSHEYRSARRAFRRSIEFAGRSVEQGTEMVAFSVDYNIARCYGLGIGWIAYNAARLDEAAGALVMARRLMMFKRAKFISAYIDVVHAAIMLSESMEATVIHEAIALLTSAVSTFLPEKGFRQVSYALRAQNELGHAHLRLAMGAPIGERERHLTVAQRYVNMVKKEAKKSQNETRTYWMATITEARILRAKGDYDGAFKLTKAARERGGHEKFTLIDACIGMGEAAMGVDPPNYSAAVGAFEEALTAGGSSRKISAVCHLHLCRAHLMNDQPARAMEHFRLWEMIEPNVENAFIAELGAQVRRLFAYRFQPFALSKDDLIRRTANAHLNALRRWLAETAVAMEHDDHDRAAKLLGVHTASVQGWLRLKD